MAGVVGLIGAAVRAVAGYLFDRERTHHAGLLRLQFRLNIALDTAAMNKGRAAKVRGELLSGTMVFVFPQPFEIDETYQRDLYNLTLINEIMQLNAHLVRFNEALASLKGAYTHLRDNHVQKHISQPSYEANVKPMERATHQLRAHLDLIEARTRQVLARVRVQSRKDQALAGGLRRLFLPSKDAEPGEIKKEMEKMHIESAEVSAALKRELDGALAVGGDPNATGKR